MPSDSTNKLISKFAVAADAWNFLSQRIDTALATLDKDGTVNISTSLKGEQLEFVNAVKAMGFSVSEPDKGDITVSKGSLERWKAAARARSEELLLVGAKLGHLSPDAEKKLQSSDLNDLEIDLANVPETVPPPSGRARAFYLVMSSSRTMTTWVNSPNDLRYEKLLAALDAPLNKNLNEIINGRFANDQPDFFNTLAEFRRQVELLTGKDFNYDSTFKRGYEAWEADVRNKLGVGSRAELEQKAANFHTAMRANGMELTQHDAYVFVETAYIARLREFVPNLGKNLLSGSEYAELQKRIASRTQRQQSGRLYGSIAGLWAAADESAYANSGADGTSGAHALKAAQQIASSLQVPYSFAYALYEAQLAPEKNLREVLNNFLDPRKKSPLAPTNNIVLDELKEGRRVDVGISKQLDQRQLESLIGSSELSKFGTHSLKETKKRAGKSGAFILADLMSLAVEVNDAASGPKVTAAERAQLALKFLADMSFLGADTAPIFLKGSKVTLATKGAGAGGVLFASLGSLVNVLVTAEKNHGKPNEAREIALSAMEALTSIFSMGVGIAMPTAGMLIAMLTPNFASISQALNLKDVYDQLVKEGRPIEAGRVKTLHTIAALDSTPIVNSFGAIYRSVLGESLKIDPAKVDAWIKDVLTERTNALMTGDLGRRLMEQANKLNVHNFHLITTMDNSLQYDLKRNPGHASPPTQMEKFSSWFDLSVDRTGAFDYNDPNFMSSGLFAANWQIEHFRNKYSQKQYAEHNEEFVRKDLQEVTLKTGYQRPSLSLLDSGSPKSQKTVGNFYLIENGESSKAARLVLDHSTSWLNTVYQSADVSNLSIKAGRGDDRFILGVMPVALDGGEGTNVVDFSMAKKALNIDMGRGKNIQLWIGSGFNNNVTGSQGNDFYRSGDSAKDTIDMGAGDDFAVVNEGAQVYMGDGDDTTFFRGIAVADGGAGLDTADFSMMREGIEYKTGSPDWGGEVTNKSHTAKSLISGYEMLVGTDQADTVSISSIDGIKVWSLGNGDDEVKLGSASDTTIFLGEGNNILQSDAEADTKSYDNVAIHGGNGNDRISVTLNNTRRMTISGGFGDDLISVDAAKGSFRNRVEIVGGNGNDTIRLNGNVQALLRFGANDGNDHVYDSAKRDGALTLLFDGQLTASDIQKTVTLEKGASGHFFNVQIKGGNTTVNLHTYARPADILIQTRADQVATKLDFDALYQPPGNRAASSTSTKAARLLESMASFQANADVAATGPTHYREPSRVDLAVAA